LASRLASVRAIDVPVLDLLQARSACAGPLAREAVLAVENDGAEAIVLGCTGMAGLAAPVVDELRRRGLPRIPVIDPRNAALAVAAGLVEMDLTHSRLAYPVPAKKAVVGCPLP
jgi:allantoin racemase